MPDRLRTKEALTEVKRIQERLYWCCVSLTPMDVEMLAIKLRDQLEILEESLEVRL